MMKNGNLADLSRKRVKYISIMPQYTPNRERQQWAIAEKESRWLSAKNPVGLLSSNILASIDGLSLLTINNWGISENLQKHELVLSGIKGGNFETGFGQFFKICKSISESIIKGEETNVSCAFFATDGFERQRFLVNRLLALVETL